MAYNYNDVDSEPLIIGWRLNINDSDENSTLVEINQFVEKSIKELWKLRGVKNIFDLDLSNIVMLKTKIIWKET